MILLHIISRLNTWIKSLPVCRISPGYVRHSGLPAILQGYGFEAQPAPWKGAHRVAHREIHEIMRFHPFPGEQVRDALYFWSFFAYFPYLKPCWSVRPRNFRSRAFLVNYEWQFGTKLFTYIKRINIMHNSLHSICILTETCQRIFEKRLWF